MNLWLFVFASFLLAALVSFLVYERSQTRKHKQCVRSLYASPILDELQDVLHFASKHAVEWVSVDQHGIYLRFLSPGYGDYHYHMRSHGYRQLTPKQQRAMRTVLEERLPHLNEKDHYHLSRQTKRLSNGDVEYAFTYTMDHRYKKMLTRAPYYAPRMVPYMG